MDHPDLLERIKRLSNDLFQLRTAVAEAETDDTETRRNYIAALAAMCRDRAAEIEAAALMATQPPAAPHHATGRDRTGPARQARTRFPLAWRPARQ